ncbi:PQQ-binding-like beta-propeller repeat protein, partial [bacterium]|nr:PQQ-binding-like beta-propeller repeat protein [bacterium]
DGNLEIVVGSNDGNVYALDTLGSQEWSYTTGGAVYSSPALANRGSCNPHRIEWQMFRHDARRTGFYGPPSGELDIYVGSDDGYLYLLNGDDGSIIDRFEAYQSYSGGIHTSPSVGDVDGDKNLEMFFYDWGQGSAHYGHTFWALEDRTTGVDKVFLTPNKLNVKRKAEHEFKIHVFPCKPIDVSVGDAAEVWVEGYDQYEYEAVVSGTDCNGAATDIAIKIYGLVLTDNSPKVAIFSINGIPVLYHDGSEIDDLQLDTFSK